MKVQKVNQNYTNNHPSFKASSKRPDVWTKFIDFVPEKSKLAEIFWKGLEKNHQTIQAQRLSDGIDPDILSVTFRRGRLNPETERPMASTISVVVAHPKEHLFRGEAKTHVMLQDAQISGNEMRKINAEMVNCIRNAVIDLDETMKSPAGVAKRLALGCFAPNKEGGARGFLVKLFRWALRHLEKDN